MMKVRIVALIAFAFLLSAIPARSQTISNPNAICFQSSDWDTVVNLVKIEFWGPGNAPSDTGTPTLSSASIPKTSFSLDTINGHCLLFTAMGVTLSSGVTYVATISLANSAGAVSRSAASNPFLFPLAAPAKATAVTVFGK